MDQINLNHLRVFESVYRNTNMTEAARELHLTQSGISQHIKNLEDTLKFKLFDRIKHRLLPTQEAIILYAQCEKGFQRLEDTLLELTGRQDELTGKVTIGTPPEFGDAILIPILSEFLKKHRHLKVDLKVGLAAEMNEGVLNGDLDFAFVDSFTQDRRLRVVPIFDEIIELCASKKLKLGKIQNRKSYYESLPYVAYLPGEPILRMWFEHHLKTRNIDLDVRAYATDCQSVARFVLGGIGIGAIPNQLVNQLQKQGQNLICLPGSKKALTNKIGLAYLNQRTFSIATQTLLDSLKDAIKN